MMLSFDMQGSSPSVHVAFMSPWGSIWVPFNTLLQFLNKFCFQIYWEKVTSVLHISVTCFWCSRPWWPAVTVMNNIIQHIPGEGVPEIYYLTLVLEQAPPVKNTKNRHFQWYLALFRINTYKELITAIFLLFFEHVQELTFTEGFLFSIYRFLNAFI